MSADPIMDAMVAPDRYAMEALSCVEEISAYHDQWMGAVVRCDHGTFSGVSNGFNWTQALTRAATAFRLWHEVNGFNEDDEPNPPQGEKVHVRRGTD